jgi:cytidine deaminase
MSESPPWADLIAAAGAVREHAYAPYSHFAVGAAVEAGSGRIYVGANVENASYGLTICAERAAIFAAITAGERVIRRLAIVTGAPAPTPPCGACRQVLDEFGPRARVAAATVAGDQRSWTMEELLPEAFGAEPIT